MEHILHPALYRREGDFSMRKALVLIAAMAATATVSVQPAMAKGCIRGAMAGGVAGHFVGKGHALAGAAAGCIVAHHHYAKKAREAKAAAHAGHPG
ncbi:MULTISPECIES: hypothetical protein [unclassified Novosphingobium]|nr:MULTISPECIES: hypothetical protein [unclassified Novosphingobium]MBB3502273.1 putative membrane protein YdjX (TVP38/TMEM64 family) [Novosphingobium sp. BK336]MBB3557454.1 putative membrane protein YdjX (TVP38/TMEM64 family) [Novosphingobium sp. BK349]